MAAERLAQSSAEAEAGEVASLAFKPIETPHPPREQLIKNPITSQYDADHPPKTAKEIFRSCPSCPQTASSSMAARNAGPKISTPLFLIKLLVQISHRINS